MAIIPSSQILAGIVYAKSTPDNLAIANSATGGTATSLTDIILPVSLETGKIYFTQGNPAVTGVGTEFLTDLTVGQYLFYYDPFDASPILVGKILAIGSNTGLTLTDDAPATISSTNPVYCGKTNALLSTQDNIIMRLPVPTAGGSFYLPYWTTWRSTNGTQLNNGGATGNNSLSRYSAVGNPTVEAAPPLQDVPYTITPLVSGWRQAKAPGTLIDSYFPTPSDVPVYAYAELNPYGADITNLAPNTLFKLFAKQQFLQNTIEAKVLYPKSDLQAAGYPV